MITYPWINVTVLLIVTAIYALLDVFNRRNVPNYVAYITLLIGVAMALLSGTNYILNFGIAILIGILGYVLYRAGLLGGGDVFEFVFIALVMPMWPQPFAYGMQLHTQFFIPFIISVLIAAGYFSLLFIPVYYLGKKGHLRAIKRTRPRDRKSMKMGAVILCGYIIFTVALYYMLGVTPLGLGLIAVLAITSFITIVYQHSVYLEMVEFVYPEQLEEGDMIAINLITRKNIMLLKDKSGFGRLATSKMIKNLRGVKVKVPVYKDSVPFSAFVFIGVVITLIFGNLILVMVGI